MQFTLQCSKWGSSLGTKVMQICCNDLNLSILGLSPKFGLDAAVSETQRGVRHKGSPWQQLFNSDERLNVATFRFDTAAKKLPEENTLKTLRLREHELPKNLWSTITFTCNVMFLKKDFLQCGIACEHA